MSVEALDPPRLRTDLLPDAIPREVGVEKRPPVHLGSFGCGLLTPYRAVAGARLTRGVPTNDTTDADKVSKFLSSAARGAAALVMEGEPGIGTTTVWLAAIDEARRVGFRVLSARASRDEQGFALGIAAELISGIEPDVLRSLPDVQRTAVEQRLLHVDGRGPAEDLRAVHTAFTTIVNRLSDVCPVLVAVDDVQWLDAASRDLLTFAARRLKGRVGLLLTERHAPDGAGSRLHIDAADGLTRMRIGPMSARRLHRLITDRVMRPFPRTTMMRIVEVSGGNPFYALELAQAVSKSPSETMPTLPPVLAEITRRRVGHFDDEVQQVLLAAACVGDPTVEEMATITSTSVDRLVQLLEDPETQGVVAIEGNRVRFTEPLVAYAIYSQARPAHRRRMHHALAHLESTPEQRARHMALAVASADPETLLALDVAAAGVSGEGLPAVAADLLELAIGLGGGTPSRRLKAAHHHLRAADLDRSRALAESTAAMLPPGRQRAVARVLLGAALLYRGCFGEAAVSFAQATPATDEDHPLSVRAQLGSAVAQSLLGNGDVAQRHCRQAITHAEKSDDPRLISQALATHVALQCRRGLGLDRAMLDRAMRLEAVGADVPAPFSARTVNALALAWTGRLTEAQAHLADVVAETAARGADADVPWLQFHAAMVDIGLGNYSDAVRTAEDMLLGAEHMGGVHAKTWAAVPRVLAAVYAGREHDARNEIADVLTEASSAHGGQWSTPWPTMVLGFLEVSLGHYADALNILQPLLSRWQHVTGSDVGHFFFVPDAVEALIAVNDLDRAEELVQALESGGARLNHPWLSAVGARCRSMVLSARGDLDGAEHAALRAMAEHDAHSAPFERARTQLVLGQLQCRIRSRPAAQSTLEEAIATFQRLGTPIWAARAASELSRNDLRRGRDAELTPSERRIAELAATGMSNKDVAAALFISPKTVECNLGRVYRKLGIRARVELGRRLNGG